MFDCRPLIVYILIFLRTTGQIGPHIEVILLGWPALKWNSKYHFFSLVSLERGHIPQLTTLESRIIYYVPSCNLG